MPIDEAITILEELRGGFSLPEMIDEYVAVGLGIEALKQLHANRHSAWLNRADILPGETEK